MINYLKKYIYTLRINNNKRTILGSGTNKQTDIEGVHFKSVNI